MDCGYLHAFGNREENTEPTEPIISGSNSGKPGLEYEYSFVSTDEDGDDIFYYIDWGDNTNIGFDGPYTAGKKIIFKHIWHEEGNYIIKAKAKDEFGDESEWSELSITIPKSKTTNYPIIRFFYQHHNIFPFLRLILKF